MTSRPSTFFSRDRSRSCPNIGIERPGALTTSKTMILAVCFTTRVQHRGSVEREARPKCYSNALQPKRDCLSTGDRGRSENQCARASGEMQSPHCERLLFQSRRCATDYLAKRTSRLLIQKDRKSTRL